MAAPRLLAEAALALGLGAAQTVAFVHSDWAWPLPLLTLTWLVWRLREASAARATLLGLAYGTGWLTAGVWWLFISMHRYGQLPAALAAAGVLALSLALSLYLALACAAWARWRSGRPLRDSVLFAACWLLAELARGVLFTGFPWVASGYAWVDAPAAWWAPWVGVYGLGALLALAAGWLGHWNAWSGRAKWGVAGAALALLGLPAALDVPEFTRSTGRVAVSLLQTNVAQDEKFAAERLPALLEELQGALLRARGPLVVAPETALPLLPSQLQSLQPGWWDPVRESLAGRPRALLVGVPLGDFELGYTNSVLGLQAGARYRYDKHHLVPFGEFVPAGFRWFTQMMGIPLGDFARGPLAAPPFEALGQRFGPNVCYEDLFGEELARRFAEPARAPTVLVNVSNIGWFGRTVALPQHLHITRMRTLELQRPMLRATNTGVTAIVDHRARVQASLPVFTAGVLDGEVEGREGLTPYAAWASRLGLWPLFGLAVLVILGHARAGGGFLGRPGSRSRSRVAR